MAQLIQFPVGSTLGNNKGHGADGVLVGALTATALSKGLLKSRAQACLCVTDDGGTFVDETTPANEATADDVEIVGTTIAENDAIYVGHATIQFGEVDFNITTQGNYDATTFAVEYWDGTQFTAVSNLVDGTTAFEAATGIVKVTFDIPEDWAKNTVLSSINGYWIRYRCTATSGTTTPCQIGQVWVLVPAADATWSDDTTDINDAGADDVALVPAHPAVGDGFYIGHATNKFCKFKLTTGTAGVATWTVGLKYWNGSSWAAVTTFADDTAGHTTAAGTEFIHFIPPSDWVANTTGNGPDDNAGYFVVLEITAFTSMTTQPLGTQAWVYPLISGATGVKIPTAGTVTAIDCNAYTKSASNADSKFLLLNVSTGAFVAFTWTKAVGFLAVTGLSLVVAANAQLSVVQITEDGTTEFADVSFHIAA
jgi:hypothetical protein